MMAFLLPAFSSHITLNPNFGAFSGGYFHTTLRVPHGTSDMHTTSLVIDVPHGILVVKPEVPEGWSAVIEKRDLSDSEMYVSHGETVSTAPHKIILTADTHSDGVHDDHLLNIDMQLKIGCFFSDSESNTIWNNEFTTWWGVEQHCETPSGEKEVMKWEGIQKDNGGNSHGWTSLPEGENPAPYLYVEPGDRCSVEHSGAPQSGGLTWFGDYTPPEQVGIDVSSPLVLSTTYTLSIVSTMIGVFSLGLWTAAIAFRCLNKKKFGEALVGPLLENKGQNPGSV